MSFIPVLEVAISLALLYLFFSQVVSSIFEFIAGRFNWRGNYLRRYLNQALNSGNDKNWAELVYRHPSVDMLAQKASRAPTYIPSSVFVKALVDLVTDEARKYKFITDTATGDTVYAVEEPVGSPLQQFQAGLTNISEGDFKKLMQTLLLNAEGCQPGGDDTKIFEEFVHGLAVWYDGYMQRISGWYKRHVRGYLFLVGLGVAALCNLDSLRVSSYLWNNTTARQRIVAYADQVARDTTFRSRMTYLIDSTADAPATRASLRRYRHQVDSLTSALRNLGFPVGWSFRKSDHLSDTLYLAGPAAPAISATWKRHPYWLRYAPTIETRRHSNSLVPSRRRVWYRDTLLQLPPRLTIGPLDKNSFPGLRKTIAQQQNAIIKPNNLPLQSASASSANLPSGFGWAFLGWLITAAALSFGAPFWFELLNRFVNMRNVGLRPPKSTPATDQEPS